MLSAASSSEEGRGREDGVGVLPRRPAESVLSAASSSEEGRGREDGVGVLPRRAFVSVVFDNCWPKRSD